MRCLKNLICPVIIASFSMLLYINTLNSDFVYDDEFTIVNNVLIKDFRNLPLLFQKKHLDLSGEMSYRPFVTFSYFLDYAVFGLNPWGFHLTNALLHALNGILLYVFLVSLINKKERECLSTSNSPFTFNILPFLTSLLFVTHPVLTEPINAISFREELLVFFFYTAALNIYLVERRSSLRFFYALSCLMFSFALFSKEMAVTLPLIIYCYERVYRDAGEKWSRSILFKRLWGYLAVTLIYIYLRFVYFYNPGTESYAKWGIDERFLTIPLLLLNYLKLILFPVSLSAVYEIAPIKSLTFPFLIALSVTTLFLYTAFAVRKRENGISFGLLFFAVTLIPVYNIYPITHHFADRYLYLPLAGIIIFIMSVAHHATGRLKHGAYFHIFLIPILCMFSLLVIERNKVWKNDFSLWSDSVKKMPHNILAHTNFGVARFNEGKFDEAIKEFKIALSIKPDFYQAHNEIGFVYYKMGQLEIAEREFQAALKLNPNYSTASNNIGMVHAYQGKIEEAINGFERALKSRPFDPMFHFNLAFVYEKSGQAENAVQQYRAFLRLKPDSMPARQALEALLKKPGYQNIDH